MIISPLLIFAVSQSVIVVDCLNGKQVDVILNLLSKKGIPTSAHGSRDYCIEVPVGLRKEAHLAIVSSKQGRKVLRDRVVTPVIAKVKFDDKVGVWEKPLVPGEVLYLDIQHIQRMRG